MDNDAERPDCESPLERGDRQALQLRALYDAVLSIASELSVDTVLQKVVDSARALLGAEYAALGVLDASGIRLDRFIVSGLTADEIRSIGAWPQGRGLLGTLIRDPRPLRVKEIGRDPRSVGFPSSHPPMHSFLGAPVVSHGRVLGNFYLANKVCAEEFDEEDEQTLVLFAAHAAIAIDNARLYTRTHDALRAKMLEVERAERRARFLTELGTILPNVPEGEDAAIERIARRLTEHLGDACCVYMVDPGTPVEPIRKVISHGDPPRRQFAQSLVDENWTALRDHVILRRRPAFIPGDGDAREWDPPLTLQSLQERGFSALVAVPISTRNHAYGLLVSLGSQPAHFYDEDLRFAALVAERLGAAIENVRLLQQSMQQTELLGSVIRHSPSAIAVLDGPEYVLRMVNPAYAALAGQDPAGLPLSEAFPAFADQDMIHLLDRVRATGRVFTATDMPVTIHSGDRTTARQTYWSFSYVPLFGPDEQPRPVLFVGVETTQEMESRLRVLSMAEDVRRRAAEMNSLLESLAEGVTVADIHGNLVLLNAAGRRILGLSEEPHERLPEQYRGLDLRGLDGRRLPFDEWPLGRTLRGERFSDYELVLARRDGELRRVSFSGTCIKDEAEAVVLGMTVYRDVTELRELEQLREEYVSLISHDLRAPLSVVQGQADLLRRWLAHDGESKLHGSAEAIYQGSKRMNAMIQDLVDSARLESNQPDLRLEPVALPELIDDVIRRTVDPARAERVRVTVEGDLPPVAADPERLSRVFANLVGNALKYSPAGSAVQVRLRRRDGEVVVSVHDEGVGIESQDLPHVFERFFRARIGRKTDGLGLGLYIAHLIVKAHGGRIWAESPNPESTDPAAPGSVFYVGLRAGP